VKIWRSRSLLFYSNEAPSLLFGPAAVGPNSSPNDSLPGVSFHLLRISGYIVSTDAFCALSGRRLY
jgi:hypothetical protein